MIHVDGGSPTINSEGRADVVQHAHPNNVWVHGDFNITAGTTQDFIIIDISDTTNYPHVNTGYIHVEYLSVKVDAAAAATYTLEFGFLENVDGTDGDFYEFWHVAGTQSTGRNQSAEKNCYPNGAKLKSDYIVTSDISLNDTAFQTDVNLASVRAPGTANTPSGSGDMVLRVAVASGNISFDLNVSYHTHA